MKKVIIVLIVLCMGFGLVACGKTAEEKIAEEIDEEVVEEIEDANGMSWPVDKLPANMPELKGVIIVNVMSMDGEILIRFEDCDKDEDEAYREQIKNIGWKVMTDLSADEGGTLEVSSDTGELVMFGWDNENQAGAITYGPQE